MKNHQYLTTFCLFFVSFCTLANEKNTEWVKSISEKNNNTDIKVATDSEGYIYLAGTFNTSGQGKNWKLVKLKPNRDTLFVRSYNGSYNGDDFLKAISIDANDNVYLTGKFSTSNTEANATTFKINKQG